MIMTEKRILWYMHIKFLTKILGFCRLFDSIIQNWIKKNVSKVPNNLLKSIAIFREIQDDINCQYV